MENVQRITLMIGKTDWTSSLRTSNRLVSFPLTSSNPSLTPWWWWWDEIGAGEVEWLLMVQLHNARTPPSGPISELSLWLSTLTASNQVNSSWLLLHDKIRLDWLFAQSLEKKKKRVLFVRPLVVVESRNWKIPDSRDSSSNVLPVNVESQTPSWIGRLSRDDLQPVLHFSPKSQCK